LFINFRDAEQKDARLTPRSIERIVKKYALLSGVPIFTTPHTLRHSYATDLMNQGVDIRSIQEFLGHSNIATTQIYTQVTNKRLRDMHRLFHSDPRQEMNQKFCRTINIKKKAHLPSFCLLYLVAY
jgi:site-specific recombinase XerD